MIGRRDIVLVVLGGLFGPPLAAFVFLFTTAFVRFGVDGLGAFDPAFFVATLPFAYLLALAPSLLAAAGNAVVGHLRLPPLWRLIWALPLGVVPFLLFLGWLAEEETGALYQTAATFGVGLAGALVSVLSVAVVDSFGKA